MTTRSSSGDRNAKELQRQRHPWNPSTRLRTERVSRASTNAAADGAHGEQSDLAAPAPVHDAVARGAVTRERQHSHTASSRTHRSHRALDPPRDAQEAVASPPIDAIESTRAMIERAVSLAFTAAAPLDQTTFEDPRESIDSSASAPTDKENARSHVRLSLFELGALNRWRSWRH